jgi:hypothetical protein
MDARVSSPRHMHEPLADSRGRPVLPGQSDPHTGSPAAHKATSQRISLALAGGKDIHVLARKPEIVVQVALL